MLAATVAATGGVRDGPQRYGTWSDRHLGAPTATKGFLANIGTRHPAHGTRAQPGSASTRISVVMPFVAALAGCRRVVP